MRVYRPGLAVVIGLVLVIPAPVVTAAPLGDRSPAPGRGGPAIVARTTAAAPIDFGEVQVGTTSATETYDFTNGATPVEVTVTLTGANPGDFAKTADTCTGTLGASATCQVQLVFSPTAEYARSALVHLVAGDLTVDQPLIGTGVLPPSGVAWSGFRVIGSAYDWTEGAALARSVDGGTQVLHSVVEDYDTFATQGVIYRRTTTAKWSAWGLRLNPKAAHGGRASIATGGSRVYVAWASIVNGRPKVVWMRRSAAYGTAPWPTAIRLSPLDGRVDGPRVAAAGSNVYVAYTDARSGAVLVKSSLDRGATWTTKRLATVARTDERGFSGRPVVAASGSTVAVAWIADNTPGTVRIRTSADAGRTWSGVTTLGTGAERFSAPSIAMASRTAVAWVTADGMAVRVRTAGGWSPVRIVAPSAAGEHAYGFVWTGAVALQGTAGVGVAFEACWDHCDGTDGYRSDIVWRESADNGATWTKSQVAIRCGVDTDVEYEYAYTPSVLWPTATTRYLMAGRWYGPNEVDNVPFKTGLGSP
jgi:hypothetical protein